MNILLATTQFMPEVGGVPRLLWKLCLHKPREHALRVLGVCQLPVAEYGALYSEFDAGAGVPIERVRRVAGSGLTSARFFLRMLAGVRRNKVDVVLCGVGYPTAIIAAAVRAVSGVPYAVITHSEDLTIHGRLKRRLLGLALNHAQAVFVLGEFGRQQLLKLGVTRPAVHIAPPGIDPEPFLELELARRAGSPAASARPRIAGEFSLLTVARLVRRKGQDLVIRALPELRKTIPGIRYVVVGSGPDEGELRAMAEMMGVADRVTFAGPVSDAQLPAYYQACDVFVMPTRPSEDQVEVEGFGIVYLEAGAAGKPVIGGLSGGVEGAVVDGVTGFLVDPLRVDDLVCRVQQLAADAGLARGMGEAARARVLSEFTAAGYSRKIFGVLMQAHRSQQVPG